MTAMSCNDLYIGRKVYCTIDGEHAIAGIIVGIETNWELGVRYYRVRLLARGANGTEITVRASALVLP